MKFCRWQTTFVYVYFLKVTAEQLNMQSVRAITDFLK